MGKVEQKDSQEVYLINEFFCPNDFVVAFTGAHGIANGLYSVLDVAIVLKKRNINNIKFIFIGDGKEKNNLLSIKREENLFNCYFMDPIKKEKLALLLKNSVHLGLMVLKNVEIFYNGTSPNKFFDYIAAGLPVIYNYPGWIADIINNNNIGITVNPDSPNEFANALIKVSKDDSLRLLMAKNARKLAESEFARQNQTDKILNVFRKISCNYWVKKCSFS